MGKKIKTWSVTDLVVMTLRATLGIPGLHSALHGALRHSVYLRLSGDTPSAALVQKTINAEAYDAAAHHPL